MRRSLYEEEHQAYRSLVRTFVEREVVPKLDKWDEARLIDREVWLAAGRQGLLGISVPEAFGGAGLEDFRYPMVVAEELADVGATALLSSFGLQSDIVIPYFVSLGSEQQKAQWLPKLVAGEAIGAIAMTEPGAGSDLQGIRATAVRDGEHWVIEGQKTFISSGIQADVVIVVARTNPDSAAGAKAFSLFLVERNMPGFVRGRKLDKVGLHAQDTSELFFEGVRVPGTNLLGEEGKGFYHLMQNLPLERMSIAASAMASADVTFAQTRRYCFERKAFGKAIGELQVNKFALAEMETELDVTRSYLDAAVLELNAGHLSAVDAAKAKWWATELQKRVIDRCVQLHGGYGYMLEYPVARAYIDARIQTIYGGTSEVMKEIIGRDIARRAG